MIKINLVPVKEKKKQKEFFIIFCVAAFFVVMILGMLFIYVKRQAVADDLNRQIEDVKKESEGYQDKINEVKDLENKEASLDAFKKTIKGIAEIQGKMLVAIDQLALNLPDGVWLTNITQGQGNDGNKFKVQGYSFTEADLENYYSNLRRPSIYLKEITIDEKNVTTSFGNNKQLHQFEINFKVADLGT